MARTNPVFENEGAAAVWAAFSAVDPALKHALHEELGRVIALPQDWRASMAARESEALRALREAFAIEETVPSVRSFEKLRLEHPECGWPSARTVRRWLDAPTWGAALVRANLEAPPDAFYLTANREGPYGDDEVKAALQDCAAEMGRVPTYGDYLRWCRKAAEEERPGRRPSWGPIVRHFATWAGALAAAGLISGTEAGLRNATGSVAYAGRFVTDEQIREGLRVAADEVGGSPRGREYTHFREKQFRNNGKVYPSPVTIHRRFGTWDAALEQAGLEPFAGRHDVTGRPRKFSDEEIRAAVAEGYAAVGDPFNSNEYERWRRSEIAKDVRRADELPALATVAMRIGWSTTLRELTGATDSRAVKFDDEAVIAALAEALETEDRLTTSRYQQWRLAEIRRDRRRSAELPSITTIGHRFGWREAIRRARNATTDGGAR